MAFAGRPTCGSGRSLNRASAVCLGLPLAVLVAGVWLAEALAPGQAWLAIPAFAGVSGAVARSGSRVDALLLEEVLLLEDALLLEKAD